MPNYQNNPRNYNRQGMNSVMPTAAGRCMDDCYKKHDILDGMPLAMAYVPWQEWKCPYEPQKGLQRGTIFPELDKPFYGKGGCRR